MSEEPPKRGRGRPPKLPPGNRHGLRCELVNGEIARFRAIVERFDMSQTEFSRACLLHAIAEIEAGRVPRWLRRNKK